MPYPTKKLGEICDINGGDAAPQDYAVFSSDGVPFVRMQDLGRYHVTDNLIETRDKIKTEAINKLRIKIFPKGSIILPRSGSVFANHRAILGVDAAVVSHIAILNNYKGVEPRYLFWYLTKLDIGRHAVKTSNVDSISFQRLGKFEIPIPALNIQNQIVERLDKIAEAQKLNDNLIQKSDELFQSLLHQELNQAGKNWEVKRLGEVADFINGRAFKPKDWGKRGLPIIRIQNLNNKEASFNYYEGEIDERYLVRDGDLLFSWSGNIGTSFGAFIWDREDAILNQHIFKINIKNINLDKDYFFFYINKIIAEIERKTHGITGLVHITKGALVKVKISIPSLEIQKQIVAKLSAVQEYKTQLLAQKSKLKELFDSVLSKSMTN